MSDAYRQFLEAKVAQAERFGFDVDAAEVNPRLLPHQRDCVLWAVAGGRRALFEKFGLGKTVQQLEILRLILTRVGGRGLIVTYLGVRQEFQRDAVHVLGWKEPPRFIQSIDEAGADGIYLTNYESIRDGKLDPRLFSVASLDEGDILRGFGGTKTFRECMRLFAGDGKTLNKRERSGGVPYRFVATATPSPNELLELAAYAAFLGIMEVSDIKSRFFKRDSTKADNLTLHPHKEAEWWAWIATWALFLQKPSDLSPEYSDEGYDLPELDVRWHQIPTDYGTAGAERDGQGRLFPNASLGVVEASREKRNSLQARIAKMMEIRAEDPAAHRVIWHDLESERQAIEAAIPTCRSVYGSQDIEEREQIVADFKEGLFPELAAKPVLLGSGTNLQKHCHHAIYLGIGWKFKDLIQSVHRLLRYLQKHRVRIDLIYTEAERDIRADIERKWTQHNETVAKVTEIIREHGLSQTAMIHALTRSLGVERIEVSGEHHRLVNNDCVDESRRLPSDSVDLILTSVPFCYDQQTEILTTRGWLRFGDIGPADQVATVNQDRLCFEWQRPTKIVWEHHTGEMLKFGNRCFDLLVTPNHKMFVARRGKGFGPSKLRLVEAAEIARDYEASKRRNGRAGRLLRGWRTCLVPPTLGDGARPPKIIIPPLPNNVRNGHGVQLYWIEPDDFMRLAGWYLSEGHADPFTAGRCAGRISIAQVTNENYRQEIADLFVRIGLPPTMHSRQIMVWCRNLAYFLIAEFGHGSKQKRIPGWVRECHPDLLRILRDTMMKGDGAANGTSYTSYSRELRDHFQEICLKTGWRATINGNHVYTGAKQSYPEIRSAPARQQYSGMIGCATVPNGTLIVRRNGKPCISGNSTQYSYSPRYEDFGHTDNNAHFFRQMDFLTPELLRVLKPGRLAAIHVKDRIVPGGMTGLGMQTVFPFHAVCIEHFARHGFAYMGMKTIVTDVVRENNQTYRLGWTEQCKDGTKMGVGMPEYLLLFRRPPTDTTNSYADTPVVKSKDAYSRARWQVDAHGFTRSSGNRPITAQDLAGLKHDQIFKVFRDYELTNVYDFEHHVKIGEAIDARGRLPVTFMLLQPPSWHPDVWSDVTRMLTLNGAQSAKGKEMHLCPMQFDLADRAIEQWTMPGELVYDPFAGLATVPYRAILKGRRGLGVELSTSYFLDGAAYCEAAERQVAMPDLFAAIEPADGKVA